MNKNRQTPNSSHHPLFTSIKARQTLNYSHFPLLRRVKQPSHLPPLTSIKAWHRPIGGRNQSAASSSSSPRLP